MSGEVSLTCDAWQASTADGYFAVTGHWIEETPSGDWTLEHALFGFTQMNTAHDGVRLGQALFKICDRLCIVHKVRFPAYLLPPTKYFQIGHITCDNACNNNTMLKEFAGRFQKKTGRRFDTRKRHIRSVSFYDL